VCGNGIIEGNERCDGGPYCDGCFSQPPVCCQGAGVCREAPSFILYFNVIQFCNPDDPRPGEVCQPDGSCDVETFPSTPICCETAAGCNGGTADNTFGLWSFRNQCEGAQGGQIKYPAACVAGTCVQQ
jgi:hypothetical protein